MVVKTDKDEQDNKSTSFTIGSGKNRALAIGSYRGKAIWNGEEMTEISPGCFVRTKPNSQSPSLPTDQSPDSDQ
jgi:hypothetical protein